jgi:hypothetical protein
MDDLFLGPPTKCAQCETALTADERFLALQVIDGAHATAVQFCAEPCLLQWLVHSTSARLSALDDAIGESEARMLVANQFAKIINGTRPSDPSA